MILIYCLEHFVNESNEEDEGERGVHITGVVAPEENISIKSFKYLDNNL